MLNWNRHQKTRATRNHTDISGKATGRHRGDKHRVTFVLVQGEPLEPLGKK